MEAQTNMERLLIDSVRARECLYNNKTRAYKDGTLKAVAWNEIASEIGKPARECRGIWTGLRNSLLHAIARRKVKAEQGKSFNKWKYEDEMAFLFPFLESRRKRTDEESYEETNIRRSQRKIKQSEENTDVSSNEDSQTSSFVIPKKETYAFVENEEPDNEDESDEESQATYYKIPKRKKSVPRQIKEDTESQRNDYYQTLPMNEIDLFFASIAKSVIKLPLVEQIHLKNNIMKMVGESEMRQIEKNQIMLSEPQLDDHTMNDKKSLTKITHNSDPLY